MAHPSSMNNRDVFKFAWSMPYAENTSPEFAATLAPIDTNQALSTSFGSRRIERAQQQDWLS
jgi:hypothetical protein